MTGKRRIIAIGALVVFLAGLSAPLSSWVLTELAVRKLIARPTCRLSDAEEHRISEYMCGHAWYRCPLLPISGERQKQLVNAGIARVANMHDTLVLVCAAKEWQESGSFSMIPAALSDAIRRGVPRLGTMYAVVGFFVGPEIYSHVDVDFVMVSSKDPSNDMIHQLVLGLETETLRKHRDACLAMLRRDDVMAPCKTSLLERIVNSGAGAAWFQDKPELVAYLESHDDDQIRALAGKIRKQLAEAPGKPGKPGRL